MEPVPALDYDTTSRRPQWEDLPAGVRDAVARAAGGSVARAEPSVTTGFSGGFAAVLHLGDGRPVFAKAGSGTNPHLLAAYAREAHVLGELPAAVPAPRLVGAASLPAGSVDHEAWQVVVAEAIAGRTPHPWTRSAVAAVHGACLAAAEALDPPPTALDSTLGSLVDDYAKDEDITSVFTDLASGRLALTWGQPGWLPQRYGDLDALLAMAVVALAGTTGCHGDLRADNVLVEGDAAVIVDWNWLSLGPPWVDFAGILPLARAEGVDADSWVRRSPLTRDADPEHLDAWLAVVAAYMLRNADQPLWPGGTAAIRVHQRRYARTFLDWLAARRGWIAAAG